MMKVDAVERFSSEQQYFHQLLLDLSDIPGQWGLEESDRDEIVVLGC
jgi:hypothetical protein